MSDIKGLEQWEGESREWNIKAGKLKMRAGVGLVNALENWYASWNKKKTERAKREYLTWRLRLHLKHNSDPDFLQELNEVFTLGLYDDEIGPTYWDIVPEHATGFRTGYNWRRDSGFAIQGGSGNRQQPTDGMEEPDSE